jgi:hypothetical protein
VLVFMMSVVGLSLPEVILLQRVLKPQLIAVFVGAVAVVIILTGYLFNLVMLRLGCRMLKVSRHFVAGLFDSLF